jgi:bifunctional non-homologous end joining protein LigD
MAPMPLRIEPMLATLSDLPPDPEHYSFEFKWDGVRALTFWDGHRLVMRSRNMLEITDSYPELHKIVDVFDGSSAILDGEIVAMDENDRPSFPLLQRRMHVQDRRSILRLMHDVPVYYILFDLLYLDGKSTMDVEFERRREMLEELTIQGPKWRVSPAAVGEGKAMYDTAVAQGLEGVVAKRLNSVYEPGKRSGAWLKIKVVQRQEFVVGGWTPEKGDNLERVGRLLLGYYEPGGKKLHHAGSVGSGFSDATHRQLVSALRHLHVQESPFAEKVPRGGLYVKPELVAEVEYRRWPAGGLIHQAAFKGLREDKKAKDVTREEVGSRQ